MHWLLDRGSGCLGGDWWSCVLQIRLAVWLVGSACGGRTYTRDRVVRCSSMILVCISLGSASTCSEFRYWSLCDAETNHAGWFSEQYCRSSTEQV